MLARPPGLQTAIECKEGVRLRTQGIVLGSITVENLSIGGALPINTSGGLLGEAYIHGMNGITEAVRQVRGTSCNQVEGVEHVLVTAGTGVPTSGLILGRG